MLIKPLQHIQQIIRQSLTTLYLQFLRDTVESLRHAACNAGQGITVATQGYCHADHIHEGLAFQECGDGFRDGFLTGFYMAVAGANFITSTAEIVMEVLFNVGLNLCLGAAGAGQEDGRGNSFRTFL